MLAVRSQCVTTAGVVGGDIEACWIPVPNLPAGTSPLRAVTLFESTLRASSRMFRCYRAWEIVDVGVMQGLQSEIKMSFSKFGSWLLCLSEAFTGDEQVLVYMREPLGFKELLTSLEDTAVSVAVQVVVPSSMISVPLKLTQPLRFTALMIAAGAALGGVLGSVSYQLILRGSPLTSDADMQGISDGDVLFYCAANFKSISIGVLGWYKSFDCLINSDRLTTTAQLLDMKCRVLREFGVLDADALAGQCALRSSETHVDVHSLTAMEPTMDLFVPGALVANVTVLNKDAIEKNIASNNYFRTKKSDSLSPPSSPNVGHRIAGSNINETEGKYQQILLLTDWSWSECIRSIGKILFGLSDEPFDVLEGSDLIDDVNQISTGANLVVRPYNSLSEFHFFNYIFESGSTKAGVGISVANFPLSTQVLFQQVSDLWKVPQGCSFRLYAPSRQSKSARTEILNNVRMNAPKAGKIVRVTFEPVDFIIIGLTIDSSSYAMLDDLLVGVPRESKSVCFPFSSLSDTTLFLRDISLAFGLPSSVTIESICRPDGTIASLAHATHNDGGQHPLSLGSTKDCKLILRQAAPVELSTLAHQHSVSEVILQQLWGEHCSLQEIAWVLENFKEGQQFHLDIAKDNIFSRRRSRIPNERLVCVECPESDFSISPADIIRYMRVMYGVDVCMTLCEYDSKSEHWFFECETPETAIMMYQFEPLKIKDNLVIFLAPNADDAVYSK